MRAPPEWSLILFFIRGRANTGGCCCKSSRTGGGVDLDAYTRPTQSKGLWEEYKEIKSSRNFILHRGATATVSEAEIAAQVAIAVLEDVFPTAIDSLYPLSLDGDLRIKS